VEGGPEGSRWAGAEVGVFECLLVVKGLVVLLALEVAVEVGVSAADADGNDACSRIFTTKLNCGLLLTLALLARLLRLAACVGHRSRRDRQWRSGPPQRFSARGRDG
jgi:hypothetical protein